MALVADYLKPFTPGTSPSLPSHAVVRSASIRKGKEGEGVTYEMGLIVLISNRTAMTTNVASQMMSDSKSAWLLDAFGELVSWQRRRN